MGNSESGALHSSSSGPRYQALADILQNEIESGVYPVGTRMPTELELCNRFSVSRFTVREALRRMIDNGMILRRQGSGTVVVSKNPTTMFVQKLNSIDELLQYSIDTRLKVENSVAVEVDVNTARMIGCEPGDAWHKIESVRYLDEKSPICWTNVYVRPEHSNLADRIGEDATPVFMIIEKEFDVVAEEVTMDLFAGSIEETKAWAMGVEAGSPTLIIVRKYKDKTGRVFEVSVSEHPAGRFTFSIDLLRSSNTD
ncbi:MAG: GntR family transcriptional regulator [Alphaproteobacteria bacterium]|nr:GntR family transcriptional regulator [Alphaproteobacteria bacterium]